MTRWTMMMGLVAGLGWHGVETRAQAEGPWPAEVPGHVAPRPGEHPRLLFRRGDLDALRARARTPEGQAILRRLRVTLDGRDGRNLPRELGQVGRPGQDGAGPLNNRPAGEVLTFSHPAGYGFLYQITGERIYAVLAREAMDAMLAGHRGRDLRYSLREPFGALRAGPVIGWVALGYDLAYDGWDDAYRREVAQFLAEYNEGRFMSLPELVRGSRHSPTSNHWGMQVGGGAMAILAIMNDPGVDMARIGPLLETSQQAMRRHITDGFGDAGYFAEGDGTGTMASHIVYLSAIQAWEVAGGQDFYTPSMPLRWTSLRWFQQTIPQEDRGNLRSGFPTRCDACYPHNIWARSAGVSGAGYFSIGYGVATPAERAGIWWWYQRYVQAWDEQNGTPFDTVSPYPHHSILAFVNTPFGTEPLPMEQAVPRNLYDSRMGFYAFRNRWEDEDDILITQLARRSPARFRHGPDPSMMVWHHGRREQWGTLPARASHWDPRGDGSAIVGGESGTWVAIDFSGASGAPGMIVMAGPGAPAGARVEAGGTTFSFKFLTPGGADPVPRADGAAVVVGRQRVSMEGGKLTLAVMADPFEPPVTPAMEAARAAPWNRASAPAQAVRTSARALPVAPAPAAGPSPDLVARQVRGRLARQEAFPARLFDREVQVTGLDDAGMLALASEGQTVKVPMARLTAEDQSRLLQAATAP